MSDFRADLHCHTTSSDGTATPEEVVQLAQEVGLKGLSVTDHDTIAAYSRLIPVAERLGIELISGVEFSTAHQGENVHVLAYSFALDDPNIIKLCNHHINRRHERNREMIRLLAAQGMPLDEDELLIQNQIVGRPHIAMALLEKGYVKSIEEVFKHLLGDGCSCYVQGQAVTTEETLEVIHKANAYAVIAHPHLIKNNRTILQLLDLDFDGIEAYYAKFLPEVEKQWVKIGKRKNWMVTGGSDYHGLNKPTIPLGCSWVGRDVFDVLLNRYQQNSK